MLGSLGERESGTARLEEALAAFRAALEEWTRERVPLDWAATQNNLGNALERLGERESGTARLDEAVAAYSAALEERTRERVPLEWAQTQIESRHCARDSRPAGKRNGAARGGGRGLERLPGSHKNCLAARLGSSGRNQPRRGAGRDRAQVREIGAPDSNMLSDGVADSRLVIPAQAGIWSLGKALLDARVRGHDKSLR